MPLEKLKTKILLLESKDEARKAKKEEREIREGHVSNLHPRLRSLQDHLGNLLDLIQLHEQRSKLRDLHQLKSVAESSASLKLLQLQSPLKIKITAAMALLITPTANGIFTMIAPTLMMAMATTTLITLTTVTTTAMKGAGERCTILTSTSCST